MLRVRREVRGLLLVLVVHLTGRGAQWIRTMRRPVAARSGNRQKAIRVAARAGWEGPPSRPHHGSLERRCLFSLYDDDAGPNESTIRFRAFRRIESQIDDKTKRWISASRTANSKHAVSVISG